MSIEKRIVAIGISSALFIVLMKFASIPSPVANTSINLAFGFLGFVAVIFGPIVALLVGLIGHTLHDFMFFGTPWYSWIIASGVFGLTVGIFGKFINLKDFNTKSVIVFSAGIIIASVITWIVVAPTLDIMIYAEPADKVYAQGAVAAITNSLAGVVLGNVLLLAYSKRQVKDNSLSKEN